MNTPDINNIIESYKEDTAISFQEKNITVKKDVGIEDVFTVINSIVISCFNDETGEYTPEVEEFVRRCLIIETFTDFIMPKDMNDRFHLVFGTELYKSIIDSIPDSIIEMINSSVAKKIDYLIQCNIETVNTKISDAMNKVDEMENSVQDLINALDADTMNKVLSTIVNGLFDYGKLLNAFKEEANKNIKVVE